MKAYPISIIITVYKNYSLFFKNLKINKKYFSGCEVIIINDYPKEKIAQKIQEIFSQAKIIENKKTLVLQEV